MSRPVVIWSGLDGLREWRAEHPELEGEVDHVHIESYRQVPVDAEVFLTDDAEEHPLYFAAIAAFRVRHDAEQAVARLRERNRFVATPWGPEDDDEPPVPPIVPPAAGGAAAAYVLTTTARALGPQVQHAQPIGLGVTGRDGLLVSALADIAMTEVRANRIRELFR